MKEELRGFGRGYCMSVFCRYVFSRAPSSSAWLPRHGQDSQLVANGRVAIIDLQAGGVGLGQRLLSKSCTHGGQSARRGVVVGGRPRQGSLTVSSTSICAAWEGTAGAVDCEAIVKNLPGGSKPRKRAAQ